MNSRSLRIVGVDLSYRATGFCTLDRIQDNAQTKLSVAGSGTIQLPPLEMGFEGLRQSARNIRTTYEKLSTIIGGSDIMLIEVPAYSQSAKAALAIGLCWGIAEHMAYMHRAVLIDPSVLKTWSGSKRGDAKDLVAQKVHERITLFTKDDNVVDAAGIALMFSDAVSCLNHQ